MPWRYGKWRSARVRLEDLEVVAPVYESSGGRLFKVLLSTACRMDCLYCPLRAGCRVYERRRWEPRVLAETALRLYREGRVTGVFISSGLYGDPERVSEDIVEAARLLREKGYRGYLHLRLMPGTPPSVIREAAGLADRLGVNLEAPNPGAFSEIAPSKGSWSLDILSKLAYAAGLGARVDSQLVVGAATESDEEHLRLMEVAVELGVERLHYSPYTPVPGTPLAEKRPPAPPWRAKLLYQAWSLIHEYRYRVEWLLELLDERGMLPMITDLKEELARRHPEWFPVDPWEASLEELMRVPGIGPRTARKLVQLRREGSLTLEALRKTLGSRWLRASRYLDLSRAPLSRIRSGRPPRQPASR